ncbi:hypothetical protein [Nonomuraea lactucae]|uniref:hypothetical protein n=1 Tax=Nonomuraea lactucae TaxID=2249762 RepID=UPI0013B366C0|nr:hypothetical protein [Nonomuraea lactucae]
MGRVPRDLNYGHDWPVPGFVGLAVAQAMSLADETGIILLEAASAAPVSGRQAGRIIRQHPHITHYSRPTKVTVWITSSDAGSSTTPDR